MRYQGSAAYQLDASQRAWEVPVSRPLSVHEGGRLDARARQGVSSSFMGLVRMAIVVAVAFVTIGSVRIGLTAATVSCLRDIAVAEANVSKALDTRTDLRIERSALSSADRIQRIATENYGMVYASSVDTVVLPDPDAEAGEGAEEASADDAQIAEDVADAQPVA